MLAIGTVLQGRYRIVSQLGQGGMGAVYKAVDERLNKTVAVKEVVFESETPADKNQRNLLEKAFQREANSLVKARHKAVPDVTDFFSEAERLFLVMEYVEGDDLAKMLEKRGKPFSLDEVSPWIDQLLEALEYLHNLVPPILHRDIKPQNLKLDQWQKIKLLDFGIARSTDKTSTLSQHTFLAATLNYAPLEQVLRAIAPIFREFILLKHRDRAEKFLEQDTDARCDIFGVGATFYHLLTNQVPVEVTKRALGIWEEGTDELADPSEINPEISPSVSRWLLKAMAFERENRFTSALEMKEAFREAIAEDSRRSALIGQTAARVDEAPVTRDQQLMQANTERLIEPKKTEGGISTPAEYPSSTDPAVKIGPTDVFKPAQFSLTDYNTGFSARTSSGIVADQPVADEELFVGEQETQKDRTLPPETRRSAKKKRKYIPALAIAGLLLLAVSGVGLYAVASLMSNDPPRESKPASEPASENMNASQPAAASTPLAAEPGITIEGAGGTNTNTVPDTRGKEIPDVPDKEAQKRPTDTAPSAPAPVTKAPVEQPGRTNERPERPAPASKPPNSNNAPAPKNAIRYVLCYVKSRDGTVNKIRRNSCSECPPKTACELIFD